MMRNPYLIAAFGGVATALGLWCFCAVLIFISKLC